jgi:hypothetical protein
VVAAGAVGAAELAGAAAGLRRAGTCRRDARRTPQRRRARSGLAVPTLMTRADLARLAA